MKFVFCVRFVIFGSLLLTQLSELNANGRDSDLSSSIIQVTSSLSTHLLLGKQLAGKQRENWIKSVAEQLDILSKILFDEKSKIIQTKTQAGNDLYNTLVSRVNSIHYVFFDTFGQIKSSDELDNNVLTKVAADMNEISAKLKGICTGIP